MNTLYDLGSNLFMLKSALDLIHLFADIIVMSALEIIVEELKALGPDKLEKAASYIHSLRDAEVHERSKILDEAFGGLSDNEVEEWAESVKDCRNIDVENW